MTTSTATNNKFTLICLSGAGATGKTSVVNEFLKKLHNPKVPDADQRVVFHGSIVRAYYASQNVANEVEFLKLRPPQRKTFQVGLIMYYMDQLEQFVYLSRSAGKNVVICDRSLFDHVAYTIYGSSELIYDADLAELNKLIIRFKKLSPVVFYLPYPTPWDKDGGDGFRVRLPGKDLIIDSLIQRNLHANRTLWAGTLSFKSPAERATEIIRTTFAI